jgi:hypothetical protein
MDGREQQLSGNSNNDIKKGPSVSFDRHSSVTSTDCCENWTMAVI